VSGYFSMGVSKQYGTMLRPPGRDRDRLSVNPTTFLSLKNNPLHPGDVDDGGGMCSWMQSGETAGPGTVDFQTGLCYCCGPGESCDTGCICCLACMTCTMPCAYMMLENDTVDALASKKSGESRKKDTLGVCCVFSFAEMFTGTSILPLLNCFALSAYENKIRRAGNRRKPEGICSGGCRMCAYCLCAPCVIAQLDKEAILIANDPNGQPLLRNTMAP
jgi:hypothetical protein